MGNSHSHHDAREAEERKRQERERIERERIARVQHEADMKAAREGEGRAISCFTSTMTDVDYLRSKLTTHPDFPKKGVMFKDIFPILRDPIAFETLITHLLHHLTSHTIPTIPSRKIDVIVGLDARGFLLGPVIALRLGASFVPVRKKGKLPGACETVSYEKDYGPDSFEMQSDSIKPGQSVIVVDDFIATGGSAKAAGDLITKLGGKTIEYLFPVELMFMKGGSKLDAPMYSIIQV